MFPKDQQARDFPPSGMLLRSEEKNPRAIMGVSVGAFVSVKTQGQNIKKDVRGTVSNIRSQKFGNMWKFLGGSREAIGLSGVRTYYNDSGVRVFFITLGKGTGYRIPDLNNGLRGTHFPRLSLHCAT